MIRRCVDCKKPSQGERCASCCIDFVQKKQKKDCIIENASLKLGLE